MGWSGRDSARSRPDPAGQRGGTVEATPSTVTCSGFVSSMPGGTSTTLVVGPKSIVHGPSLEGAVTMVSWLLPVAVTLVGSLGQEPLPNVTTYSRPAPDHPTMLWPELSVGVTVAGRPLL